MKIVGNAFEKTLAFVELPAVVRVGVKAWQSCQIGMAVDDNTFNMTMAFVELVAIVTGFAFTMAERSRVLNCMTGLSCWPLLPATVSRGVKTNTGGDSL